MVWPSMADRRRYDWLMLAAERGIAAMDESRVDPGWHHPSALAHPCLREKQFRFIGQHETNPKPPFVRFAGMMGTALHNILQDALVASGAEDVHGIEVPRADPQLRVRGRGDVEVVDYDGIDTIVDFKGAGDNLPSEPWPDHLVQIAWYMYLYGVAKAVLQYVKRGDLRQRVRYDVHWREVRGLWEASRDALVEVTQATAEERLLPRTPIRSLCGGCEFLAACPTQTEEGEEWLRLTRATNELLANETQTA